MKAATKILPLLLAAILALGACSSKDKPDPKMDAAKAEMGMYPADYRDLVHTYATDKLYYTYEEMDIYVSPDKPEFTKVDDDSYAWEGRFCVSHLVKLQDENGQEYNDEGWELYYYHITPGKIAIKQLNELATAGKLLLNLGTLGIAGAMSDSVQTNSGICKKMKAEALAQDRIEGKITEGNN